MIMDGAAPPPPDTKTRPCGGFFRVCGGMAGGELPGARASQNRPVNGSAASGLSRPKGPARTQGANEMKRPVGSRHHQNMCGIAIPPKDVLAAVDICFIICYNLFNKS